MLSEGRWYPAVVLAVHPAERRVDIHFAGFKSGTDRDYSVDDPKIRAPPTTEDLEVIQRNIAEVGKAKTKQKQKLAFFLFSLFFVTFSILLLSFSPHELEAIVDGSQTSCKLHFLSLCFYLLKLF